MAEEQDNKEVPEAPAPKSKYDYGEYDKPKGKASVLQDDPLDIFPSDDPNQSTATKEPTDL